MARLSETQPKRFQPPQTWGNLLKQPLRPLSADPSPSSSSSKSHAIIPCSSQSSTPSLTKPRGRSSVDARPPVLVPQRVAAQDGARSPVPGDDVPMRGDPTEQGAEYLQGGTGRPSAAAVAAPAASSSSFMCGQKASMTKLLSVEDDHQKLDAYKEESLSNKVTSVREKDIWDASEVPPRSSSQSSGDKRRKKKKQGAHDVATMDPASAKDMSCDEQCPVAEEEEDKHGGREAGAASGTKAGEGAEDEGDRRMTDAEHAPPAPSGSGAAGGARPTKRQKGPANNTTGHAPTRFAQPPPPQPTSTMRTTSPHDDQRAAVTPSPSCASASGTAVPDAPPPRGAPRSALKVSALAQHILFFIRHYTQHSPDHFAPTQDLHAAFRAALARPNNLIAPGPGAPEYLQRITVVQFGRILTQLFDAERQPDDLSFEGVPDFIRPHRKKTERGFKGLLPSIV